MRRPLLASVLLLAGTFAGAACAGRGGGTGEARGPDPIETPPRTRDPGVVVDQRPLGPTPPPERAGGGRTPTGIRPDGATCFVAEDCASGVCEGQGCSETRPGTCAPAQRACTRDLRPYCGCDGVTFRTSGSCPGRRYASASACSTGN